jgi:hypothetical protein
VPAYAARDPCRQTTALVRYCVNRERRRFCERIAHVSIRGMRRFYLFPHLKTATVYWRIQPSRLCDKPQREPSDTKKVSPRCHRPDKVPQIVVSTPPWRKVDRSAGFLPRVLSLHPAAASSTNYTQTLILPLQLAYALSNILICSREEHPDQGFLAYRRPSSAVYAWKRLIHWVNKTAPDLTHSGRSGFTF